MLCFRLECMMTDCWKDLHTQPGQTSELQINIHSLSAEYIISWGDVMFSSGKCCTGGHYYPPSEVRVSAPNHSTPPISDYCACNYMWCNYRRSGLSLSLGAAIRTKWLTHLTVCLSRCWFSFLLPKYPQTDSQGLSLMFFCLINRAPNTRDGQNEWIIIFFFQNRLLCGLPEYLSTNII